MKRNVGYFIINGEKAIKTAMAIINTDEFTDDNRLINFMFDNDAIFDVYGAEVDTTEDDTMAECERDAIDFVEIEVWIIAAMRCERDYLVHALTNIQVHGL